jgi:thioesterase domain-containing protein/acyl carrier protein
MIMEAFSSVLDIDRVGPDDHFFHLGGNSLCAIRLLAELRKALNTDFPASIIYRVPTPRKLSEELDTLSQNADAERHLIHLRGERSDQRVLVLPGVGGHPLGFGPLIDLVNTQRSFVGVQYPNEQELNEIGRSLPLLAEWLIKKLNLEPGQSIPDLIGYSFGGSLALEVALQLRRQGHSRGRLLLLDAHLPCGLPKRGKIGTARAHLARIVEGHESSRIAYIKGRLSARQAPSEGGKAPPTESEIHEYRAISRINRQMVVEYQPACRYDGPVTLIRANQPEWLRFHKDDGYNGYSAYLDTEQVSLEAVNAGHLDLFKPAAVHDIARIVDRWLRSPPT